MHQNYIDCKLGLANCAFCAFPTLVTIEANSYIPSPRDKTDLTDKTHPAWHGSGVLSVLSVLSAAHGGEGGEPASLSRRGFEHGGIDREELGGPPALWRRLGLYGGDHIGLCKDVQGRFEVLRPVEPLEVQA